MPPLVDFGIRDRELWSIISRGLQKALDARWQDMHSYGEALALWLLHHGVEEDVCLQSVRHVWLGVNSPSAPPVAVDAQNVARAKPAALDEQFVLPKQSLLRTAFGVAAALLTFALVAYAGLRFVRTPSESKPATPPASTREAPIAAPASTFIPAATPTEDEVPPPPPEPEASARAAVAGLRPRSGLRPG